MRKRFTLLICVLLCTMQLLAQQIKVNGTVVDQADEPVPGALVSLKSDPKKATTTDLDGRFVLSVPAGESITVSFIGYEPATKKINPGETEVRIVLKEDVVSLNEVVAIGYGTQKKKLITGSTVQVKGADIARTSNVSAFTALQSMTPGVQIKSNSGKPGDGFAVTIRGVGTTGDASPLYIIDGLVGGDLNAINPNDIESIDILKDAASTAIYGARAANGVIIVTTRHGQEGRPTVNLDVYYGWQNMGKKPQTLTAKEYMAVMDEAAVNDGLGFFNWTDYMSQEKYDAYMSGADKGTNWIDAVTGKNAPVQNYTLGVNGGSANSVYSMSIGYTSQESLVGRDYFTSKYERYNARMNSEYTILRIKDFDAIKIGENFTMSYIKNSGLGMAQDGPYWNHLRNAMEAYPIMDLMNADGTDFNPGILSWSNMRVNPLMMLMLQGRDQDEKNYMARGNFYLTIQPIRNLIFRTQFGIGYNSYTSRTFRAAYNYGPLAQNANDITTQNAGSDYSWAWDNTLTYSFTVNNLHNISAMVGMTAERWGYGEGTGGSNINSAFSDFKHAWLSNCPTIYPTNTTVWGAPVGKGSLVSYFGRANYDFDGKYMATVTLRADGSSNFAKGHRWGYFPSVSAGWNLANENFMASQRNWLDQFKIRVSWGRNGNCNIDPFQYLTTIAIGGANYFFGSNHLDKVTGSYPDKLANTDITWEKSEQLDLGFDARFLHGRLGVNFDYYNKTTKDWLVVAPILASYGTGAPYINGGDVRNRGVELSLSWNDKAGDFLYGATVNLGYNKNEVTRLANDEGIINGATEVLSSRTDYISRVQVGHPIGFFYGYKTDGVFQNEAEVNAYRNADGELLCPTAKPGDMRFVDTNGDGSITDADRVEIGNPHPDVNLGVNLNFGYKGFDLSISGVGAFGQQIAKSYRDFSDKARDSYTMDVIKDRWHGEGSSNRYPRLSLSPSENNWNRISDIYVEDGDYFRISNITLGYEFKTIWKGCPFQRLRAYATIQNLCTFTKYSGTDPEVGFGGDSWATGIDTGRYPVSRTFLLGANISF